MSERIFISMGEFCMPSYYLKELGLRHAAYPFDWLFCGPQIVLDCLETDFETFLNPHYIHTAAEGTGSGHKVYHKNLFRHKEAHTADGLAYYQRAVNRFRALLRSDSPLTVVICLASPEAHLTWRDGFNSSFTPNMLSRGAEWNPVLDWLDAKRKDVQSVVIEFLANQKVSDYEAGLGMRNRQKAKLMIQGNGGIPLSLPSDNLEAVELMEWITSDPKMFTEDIFN